MVSNVQRACYLLVAVAIMTYVQMLRCSIDGGVERRVGKHTIRIRAQWHIELLDQFRSQQVCEMLAFRATNPVCAVLD
jgi:hypothetical protein